MENIGRACVFSLWELHAVAISLPIIMEDFCRQWEGEGFFSSHNFKRPPLNEKQCV